MIDRIKEMIGEFIAELNKMDLDGLRQFKADETRKLGELGFPQKICSYITKIIDTVIRMKQKEEV